MKCACAILSSAACAAVLYFSALSHTWHKCRKKFFDPKLRALISLQLLFETFSGAVVKLRKTTISFIMSVRLSDPLSIRLSVRMQQLGPH
jgi:hypothetical protein